MSMKPRTTAVLLIEAVLLDKHGKFVGLLLNIDGRSRVHLVSHPVSKIISSVKRTPRPKRRRRHSKGIKDKRKEKRKESLPLLLLERLLLGPNSEVIPPTHGILAGVVQILCITLILEGNQIICRQAHDYPAHIVKAG